MGRRRLGAGGRRWAAWPTLAVAGVVLFALYLRLSQTVPINSDGATNALQAWDMLHGNILLRGWSASDVSFYTTDLPQYILVEALRGLGGDVVHVAAAVTYTLIVLISVLLARGSATGSEAAVRMLITAGILLAPQPPQISNGAYVLLLSPDHVGTMVPVLAAWLVLDRARGRWWPPLIAGLLLAWAVVGDTLSLLTGVAPLLLVGAARAYRKVLVKRLPVASAWWDLSLAAAAAGAAAIAWLTLALIRANSGIVVWAPTTSMVNAGSLPSRFWFTVKGVLVLFGCDNYGKHPGLITLLGAVHLAGFCVAAWATARAIRRFWRDSDLAAQLLAVGVVINLVAYLAAVSLLGARELAAVLPFSAVLAGRLLGGPVMRTRLVPLMGLLMLGYVLALGYGVTRPAAPADNQQLTSWLAARHFRYGLAGYWEASDTTLASGNRVQVRPVSVINGKIAPYQWLSKPWEIETSWYNPRLHDATFLVVGPGPHGDAGFAPRYAVGATFGPPAHTYHVGLYKVLVWHQNLLARLV